MKRYYEYLLDFEKFCNEEEKAHQELLHNTFGVNLLDKILELKKEIGKFLEKYSLLLTQFRDEYDINGLKQVLDQMRRLKSFIEIYKKNSPSNNGKFDFIEELSNMIQEIFNKLLDKKFLNDKTKEFERSRREFYTAKN